MSLRYTVYRTHDKSADLLRRVFRRRAEEATAAAQELRRLLNAHFYLVLLRTPYSDLAQVARGPALQFSAITVGIAWPRVRAYGLRGPLCHCPNTMNCPGNIGSAFLPCGRML